MPEARSRLALTVRGVVQGVGFRPFVHQLARAHGLAGFVRNDAGLVEIEIEGAPLELDAFIDDLRQKAPPGALVRELAIAEIPLLGESAFCILESHEGAVRNAALPPDRAPCALCLAEIANPDERRYRYPFTNCTSCGPRYTIVLELPYDRPRTTLRAFPLCEDCRREYEDPKDRRFHAQPMACPRCGPKLLGATIASAAAALERGLVLALKGVGGYQLLCDATNEEAVRTLRERKNRPDKALAVMFPDLASLRDHATPTSEEEALLASSEAPIVLVPRRDTQDLAASIAPQNPRIGAMLPSSPLHRLLLDAIKRPLVCTSGNLTNEPICTDNDEAHARLGAVADLYLEHDRPIARPVDDSVVRIDASGTTMLRRARGYAPLALPRKAKGKVTLALGAHLKSTIALATAREIIVSQHLGDLDSPLSIALLERTTEDLLRFFCARPEIIACDLHPDYASTRFGERLAERFLAKLVRVQHHHAHIAAVMAEHDLRGPVLGFAWDGIGLGADDDLWGGEALLCEEGTFRRVAHLRPFRLPGGEAAIREPRRAAAGLLYALLGEGFVEHVEDAFSTSELRILKTMLERSLNTPKTTSMGRLFDAAAALSGGLLSTSFEGQAAMDFEFAAQGLSDEEAYPLALVGNDPMILDWSELLLALLEDRKRGTPKGRMSARFHEALARAAARMAEQVGVADVALSGGCFQNARLLSRTRSLLEAKGFRVVSPRAYPPNDGGLSLGQVFVAERERSD